MQKITKGKCSEKRSWNASGSFLSMDRQRVDKESFIYAMMCFFIVCLILSATLPTICHAAGKSGGDFSTLTSGFTTLAQNFYNSLVVKAIGVCAGIALVIALFLKVGMPGSELERRLHGWPMKIIYALVGVAIAPSVINILINQLKAANFFTFNL